MVPRTSYFVCATARSGSTLLCDALTSTGIAGRPEEYLVPNPGSRLGEMSWSEEHRRLPLDEYLEHIVSIGTTSNGVFGTKAQVLDFDNLAASFGGMPKYAGQPLMGSLERFFPNPHWVWVTRRDKIRQAISAAKVLQTGAWNTRSPNSPARRHPPRFSYALISDQLQLFVEVEAAWASFFARHRIKPMTVVYEDLALDYAGTTTEVLRYLGLKHSEPIPAPRIKRQADSVSDEWADKYLRLKGYEHKLYRLQALPLIMRHPELVRHYVDGPASRLLERAPETIRAMARGWLEREE